MTEDGVLLNILPAVTKCLVIMASQAFRRVNARLFVVDVGLHGVDPKS